MTKLTINFLKFLLIFVLVSLLLAWGGARYHLLNISDGATFSVLFFNYFLYLFPFWFGGVGYLLFQGVATFPGDSFYLAIKQTFIFVALVVFFVFFSLLFFPDEILPNSIDKTEFILQNKLKQNILEQKKLLKYDTMLKSETLTIKEIDKALKELYSLSDEFPFVLYFGTFIDQLKQKKRNLLEKENGKSHVFYLQKKAIELRNKKDFGGAVVVYTKLLKIYPNTRENYSIRFKFEQDKKLCEKLNQDPLQKIAPNQLTNIFLNKRLIEVKSSLDKKQIYNAYFKIKNLRIAYPNNSIIERLYDKIWNQLIATEFLLPNYFLIKKYATNLVVYTNVYFQTKKLSFTAQKMIFFDWKLYLEGVTVFPKKKDLIFLKPMFFNYARVSPKEFLFKNHLFEKSVSYQSDNLDLINYLPILQKKDRKKLLLLGPLRLIKLKQISFFLQPHLDTFILFLLILKLTVPFMGIGVFLFLTHLSWLNRDKLFNVFSLIFLPLFFFFLFVIHFLIVYVFSALSSSLNNIFLALVPFLTIFIWILVSFYKAIKIHKEL